MDSESACPACEGTKLARKYVLTDPGFHTAQCRDCGFTFMQPYPSDAFLDAYYTSRALYGAEHDEAAHDRAIADRARLIEDLLRRVGVTQFHGPAVDFGAGVGLAVAAQQQLGFSAIGIEANPQAAAYGQARFGVRIEERSLDDLGDDLRLFTLFEVLEHIKYPHGFLKAVKGHMAKGGVLIGSVPNYHSLARYLKGRHSVALMWPEHVNQFSRRTLIEALKASGFTSIHVGSPSPYGVVISLGLRAWMQRHGLSRLVPVATWVKKHLVYPLPNAFVNATGWLAQGLVFVARVPE